jgi:hypothetical protein
MPFAFAKIESGVQKIAANYLDVKVSLRENVTVGAALAVETSVKVRTNWRPSQNAYTWRQIVVEDFNKVCLDSRSHSVLWRIVLRPIDVLSADVSRSKQLNTILFSNTFAQQLMSNQISIPPTHTSQDNCPPDGILKRSCPCDRNDSTWRTPLNGSFWSSPRQRI